MEQPTIARTRLAGQLLAGPAPAGPAAVVRHMVAMQAQDYLGSLWAVGARAPGATEQAVAQALAEGQIVRTWPMRGTIHLLAPEDVRWMLALLTPRVIQRSQGRYRQLGLDAATFAAGERVIVAALEGGRQLTRPAIFALLEAAGIATAGQRGYHILCQLAQTGLICFGAHAGKQPTFALLDEWVPAAPSPPRDEALAALALRYFTSRGPATLHDLCWWSGLTVAEARAGLGAVADRLAAAQVAGQTYYYDPAAEAPAPDPERPLLLPPFDEILLAYRDRGAALDPAYQGQVIPSSNGVFSPIVVLDGRVAGIWRRELRRGQVALSVSPFEPWPAGPPAGLPAAAERYGRYLGLAAAL